MAERKKVKISTEQLIMDSFKEIALTVPIEKITIKEIVEHAGVIRPTFYNHFQDKYDLLRCIIEQELIIPTIPLVDNGLFYEGLTLIFTNALKSKNFYIQAAKLDGVESFENILVFLIRDILLDFVNKRVEEGAAVQKWFKPIDAAEYYARSMCFVAMKWLRDGMKIPPSEVVYIYKMVITTPLGDILHEFERKDEFEMPHYITI